MGVDTKGRVSSNVTILDLANTIKSLYGVYPEIYVSGDYGNLSFAYKKEQRMLSVLHNCTDDVDETQPYTSLSLGMWGNSITIMTDIVSMFGGMVLENDCSNIDWIVVPKNNDTTVDAWVIDMELREKLNNAGFNTSEVVRFHQFVKSNAEYLKRLVATIE